MAFDPDKFLAESAGHTPAPFDPDAFLADGDAPTAAPAPEEMGSLKAGALGLMSGIPGAETVVSGIQAISPDVTYEQAHQNLETDKDQAWDQHPVAYGTGKTAGLVGTGLVAPEGLAGALAVGAASGVDSAVRPADFIADAAKGAAVGGVLHGVGEKVISPLINKVLPSAAKGAVATLGAPTREDIEAYLSNPEAIRNALTNPQMAEKLAGTASKLGDETSELSAGARGLLRGDVSPISSEIPFEPGTHTALGAEKTLPASDNLMMGAMGNAAEAGPSQVVVTSGGPSIESSINPASNIKDTLRPIFDELKSRYLQNGVPKSSASEAAINALDNQYRRIQEIAAANGGKLTEQDLKGQIVELQNLAKKAFTDDNPAATAKDALKNLSGALNGALKESNPAYGAAMEPVAERTGLLADVAKKFNLESTDEGGYAPTEATVTKVRNILNENKTQSQHYLEKLKDLTGIDFLDLAKNADIAGRFNKEGSDQGLNVLAHSAGYGLGALSNVPGGRLIGALSGGFIGHNIDGGRIAQSILDRYLNFKGGPTNAALQKFGPILVKAAKAGGNQLASTHYVLATSDPEYQSLMTEHQEEGN
jgi:hypothetical protein